MIQPKSQRAQSDVERAHNAVVAAFEPMIVICTAHLRPRTIALLEQRELYTPAYELEYGPLVYIGGPGGAPVGTPDDLAPVVELALRAGAVWIKFDADAGELDCLPTFDWEAPEQPQAGSQGVPLQAVLDRLPPLPPQGEG